MDGTSAARTIGENQTRTVSGRARRQVREETRFMGGKRSREWKTSLAVLAFVVQFVLPFDVDEHPDDGGVGSTHGIAHRMRDAVPFSHAQIGIHAHVQIDKKLE